MDKRIKYGLFLLLLLSFFYPFLSWRPLHGYFMKPKFPIFSFDGLLTGVYQDQLTKYVDGNIESRPFTVRMKNQVDFWMFNKICNKNFSQGENHFFYENAYIQAYNGTDFIGEDSIKNIVDNLAELKLSAEKHNKKVIVVLTPNKARCVSENIPKPFRYEGANTNYKSCRKLLSESQIPFFDVSQFFLNMKDTSEYPLFSKNGTHWSMYGASLFADSLADFLNSHGAKCPGIKFGEIETSYFARHTDDDIANVLNFLIDPPNEELAYPELVYTGDTTIKTKSLIIADSFYWTFMYLSLHEKMFGKGSSFWYYNRTAWPKFQKPDVYVQNLDLRSEILKRDLIIFFVAECNLPYFGWGFVESANEVLK